MGEGVIDWLSRLDPDAQPFEALRSDLDALSLRIKAGLSFREPPAEIDAFALQRHLFYAAIALTDDERAKARRRRSESSGDETKGKTENIGWHHLLKPYGEIYSATKRPLLCEIADDDELSKFARLETRTQGARERGFYAALAIMVLHLDDKGLFAGGRFERMCPPSERGLPQRIRDIVAPLFERALRSEPAGAQAETKIDERPERVIDIPETRPEIWIRFPYSTERLQELTDFQQAFAVEPDRNAHFIIYRPMRSDPCQLMKSFLVLKSPKVDDDLADAEAELAGIAPDILEGRVADIFEFRHYYQPPGRPTVLRVTAGRAVPLKEGLYLVGGQRPLTGMKRSFTALKVLALPWSAINNGEPLFRGLMLSTNARDLQIATRIAVRATPLHHTNVIKLGAIHADHLLRDLRADLTVERKVLEEIFPPESPVRLHIPFSAALPKTEAEMDLDTQANQILSFCNNIRETGLGVLPGFENGKGYTLNRNTMVPKILELFEKDYRWYRRTGEIEEMFTFNAIRAGPIGND